MLQDPAKDDARDNREGDQGTRTQLFGDLGSGRKSDAFALEAGVAAPMTAFLIA